MKFLEGKNEKEEVKWRKRKRDKTKRRKVQTIKKILFQVVGGGSDSSGGDGDDRTDGLPF